MRALTKVATVVHCAVLCLALAPVAEAHKDRVLTLKDGTIEGLPEQYQPATFDPSNCVLRIGRREVTFAPFVRSLFAESSDWNLRITSSWYHERPFFGSAGLPPYICFHLESDKKDYGYKVLVDMVRLRLISIEVVLKLSESSTRNVSVEIDEEERKLMEKSIRKVGP